MRIAIASDHAAVDVKSDLAKWLSEQGHEVADLGPATADRVDYPDYGYKLAEAVASGDAQYGVALCGSGIGISIAVNRHPALQGCADQVSAAHEILLNCFTNGNKLLLCGNGGSCC